MGASLCAGRRAFPDEHDANQVYVQNAVYGQQSYAGPASIDVRQKPLGGRDTSYAASRFETGQVRKTESGRNARRTEDKPRSKRDLRVDIPASMPINAATPLSASTPQTPGEDDYFNSVDEAPILMPRDSTDDLERLIQNVGPPQDTLEPIRWAKGQLIGAGAFGRVYMGMNKDSGELLAVKQVLLATNNTSKEKIHEHLKGLEAEVAVLRNLSHPNIVRYLGTDREEECLNIFLEFVPGGSIASLLSKFGCFKETVIRRYTCQLLLGLEYLHNHQIMHRDIKGANILVDNKGVIKLADFGASKKLADLATMSEGFKSMKGTPYWMAPEVIKQTGHGRQADIWSVGCTVIEMATGKPPWSQFSSGVSALFHIASSKGPPPIPECLSTDGRDFLLKCFRRDPKERPTATELLRHPFIAEAGLERTSISPSLVSSTYLPSVHSQQTPVLTSATLTNTGPRNPPSHAPTWNKRPVTPPPAPLPASDSYDDDSVQQGSVVGDPPSMNENRNSLVYESQLRPIGEDLSTSRGEYSPGEAPVRFVSNHSGHDRRGPEGLREQSWIGAEGLEGLREQSGRGRRGSQNGHRSREQSDTEEEAQARNMVQFPTGLGVGDYNNLSMMNSFNPMEEPTLVGNVNIVHWDNSLSEDENQLSAEDRRQLAAGPVGNEGTPGASVSEGDPARSRAHSPQSSRETDTGRERAKTDEGYEGKAGRLAEDVNSDEVVNEDTIMAFLDEQAKKFQELLVPLEEQANSSLRYSDNSEEHSGETEGYEATSQQQEAYEGSPSREEDPYQQEDGRNGYSDSGGEYYGRHNGYSQPDSYASPRGNGYSAQVPQSYGGARVNEYVPNPYRDSHDAAPRSFRGSFGASTRGGDAYSRTLGDAYTRTPGEAYTRAPAPRIPQSEPRSRSGVGAGPSGAEGPSPLAARARSARTFREGVSAGTGSGSSGARSSRDGSEASVVPPGMKRAVSMVETLPMRPDADARVPQPVLSESYKEGPLSKEEQWKQELARELDSVRIRADHHRRSLARQSDDRGTPTSYGGSPYGQRENLFIRQSSRLGLAPVTPR